MIEIYFVHKFFNYNQNIFCLLQVSYSYQAIISAKMVLFFPNYNDYLGLKFPMRMNLFLKHIMFLTTNSCLMTSTKIILKWHKKCPHYNGVFEIKLLPRTIITCLKRSLYSINNNNVTSFNKMAL